MIATGSLGCVVSESKYNSKKEELGACVVERDDLIRASNKLRDQMPELEARMKEELATTEEELEALREQRKELDKQLDEYQKLTQRFEKMVGTEGIKVDVRRGRLIVSLPSGVLFASGKAEISKRGAKTLGQVAGSLKDFKDRRFIVAGHTDNVRIGKKGKNKDGNPFADNWELSTARSLNVIRFLIEQGLKPRNLAAAGYGQYDSLKSNKNKRGRRLNRRIEIILEPKLPDFRKLAKLSKRAKALGKPDAPPKDEGAEDGADKAQDGEDKAQDGDDKAQDGAGAGDSKGE